MPEKGPLGGGHKFKEWEQVDEAGSVTFANPPEAMECSHTKIEHGVYQSGTTSDTHYSMCKDCGLVLDQRHDSCFDTTFNGFNEVCPIEV